MPSVSSPWAKSARWLGKCWRVAVCVFSLSLLPDLHIRFPRFLYTLFLAIDGNFKLKGKERDIRDVELMPGWGAYVPPVEYKAHVDNYVDQPEVCQFPIFAGLRLSTQQIINRSIHVNRNTMRWSELLLDLHQDMRCLARCWLFARGTA